MINGYYLFILLAIVVILVCAACTFGLRMCRRRVAENAAAEQRYSQFVDQSNNATGNNDGALYTQGGAYSGNMYYQQQQQPPQVGVVNNPSAGGLYYPGGGGPGAAAAAGPNNGRPVSATVLYAAPANGDGPGVNFGNYFPEAQVAGAYPNNTNANAAAATGAPSPSPYGEADYVSQPPQPLGTAAMPPPPQYPSGPSSGNIVRVGEDGGPKGKQLD